VLVADGNTDWAGAYREGLGLCFAISNTAFIMSLLTSAFLLLIINEVCIAHDGYSGNGGGGGGDDSGGGGM